MTPVELTTALAAILGIAGQLAISAFYYGKLSATVGSHEKRLERLEDRQDDHGTRITRLEGSRRATDKL